MMPEVARCALTMAKGGFQDNLYKTTHILTLTRGTLRTRIL